MSSFMLLCGPSHAEIVDASEGAKVLRPVIPSVDERLAGPLTPLPPEAQIEYRPWALEDRIGTKFTGFKLMIADGASDVEAISLFRDMVRRYHDRPRQSLPHQEASLQDLLAALNAYLIAQPAN